MDISEIKEQNRKKAICKTVRDIVRHIQINLFYTKRNYRILIFLKLSITLSDLGKSNLTKSWTDFSNYITQSTKNAA